MTYTFSVKDTDNNTLTNQSYTVTGRDQTPPTVSTNNITVQIDNTVNVTITPGKINDGLSDNCSNKDVTLSLDKTSFTCANIGLNTVILTETDQCSNSATGSAIVTVEMPTTTEALLSAQKARYLDNITLFAEVESNCYSQDFAGSVEFFLNKF